MLMRGYNNSGTPFVDLETSGLVVFSDHEKLIRNLLIGVAKVRDKFATSTIGGNDTILDRGGAADLQNLVKYIMSDTSHPDHDLLPELGEKAALEYIKLKYRTIYIGSSFSIQSSDRSPFANKSDSRLATKREGSEHFDFLVPEIERWNIFEGIGRIIFFMNEHSSFTPIHFDSDKQDDFVWMPVTPKKFFVYDEQTKTKHFVKGRAATFNNSDYHGSDSSPFAQLSFRIDGVFRSGVKDRLAEICERNRT